MIGEGTILRRVLSAMIAVVLFASTTTVFAEEAATGDSCPECAAKEQKLQSVTRRVSELETETAQLRMLNVKLRHTIGVQARRIRVLRKGYSNAMRRIRLLVRRLTIMFGSWKTARVSWYGPGFYGRGMAGGGVLRPGMKVFAHRTMRFGTKVQFSYRGRVVIAEARDRGPYVAGREFDLGPGTASALRFNGVDSVKWRVVKR